WVVAFHWLALPSVASIARGVPERDATGHFSFNILILLFLLRQSANSGAVPPVPFCKVGYKKEGERPAWKGEEQGSFITFMY
ncbi:MAG: hypothetical protein ACYC6S_11940, partial [Desulfobulbia bacterium]